MNYPVPSPSFVLPASKLSTGKIICIVVICVVVGLLLLGALAIALGVGLGVGLSNKSDSTSSSSSSSSSVLSAPTVDCTYTSASVCGCSATKPSFLSAKIINGYTAVSNSWPWIVAVLINNEKTLCGGFLVSFQHVITAAHCVNGVSASSINVYAGLQTLSSRTSSQLRTVSSVNVHSSYSESGYINDIAVLTLSSSYSSNSTSIGICCLASSTSIPTVGQHGVIAGWGVTSETSSTPSDNLLQAVIEVESSSSTCSTTSTSSIQFCAGYSGTDACFGDSGSPFMTSENNAWTCTGIVSSGRGCGSSSYYTRVSAYSSFINGIISG